MSILSNAATAAPAAEARPRILVWDVPTRIFHWSLAANFAIAWLTAESERLRDVHLVAGYSLFALIVFRLAWGLAGTRYARFTQFLRGPAAIARYLRSLVSAAPEHHVGHNPAGALAIVLLLGLGLATALSGWGLYNEIGGEEAFEDLHEAFANGMLAVVVVHIVGVAVSSFVHRENLVGAMVSGRKSGAPADGISRRGVVAALLLAAVLASIWGVGLGTSPARLPGLDLAGAGIAAGVPVGVDEAGKAGHDDDGRHDRD